MDTIDLQDLVDNPRENLEVELKGWLDLTLPEVRAELAKDICALANHGGGYLVFGFADNLTEQPTFVGITAYTRDNFNAIVRKYLQPTVNCEATILTSSISTEQHAVVWVPGLLTTPLCAKADGPKDQGGRIQGVKIGCHYVRDTGPASVPINNPGLWAPVIHRCVTNDRAHLSETIQAIIRQPDREAREPSVQHALLEWDRKSLGRFLALMPGDPVFGLPVSYREHHMQFSYAISHDASESLATGRLLPLVGELNHEVRDLVWTGWSMFYPFTRDPIRPYLFTEHLDGGDIDLVEANLMADPSPLAGFPDFWRIAINGMATQFRSYFEDRPREAESTSQPEPGSSVSPRYMACLLGELVRHARALASQFETADAVYFLCSWKGLAGRRLFDPDGGPWHVRVCRADARVSSGRWPVPALTEGWPEIVADLLSQLTVLFDGLQISANAVAEWSKRWRGPSI